MAILMNDGNVSQFWRKDISANDVNDAITIAYLKAMLLFLERDSKVEDNALSVDVWVEDAQRVYEGCVKILWRVRSGLDSFAKWNEAAKWDDNEGNAVANAGECSRLLEAIGARLCVDGKGFCGKIGFCLTVSGGVAEMQEQLNNALRFAIRFVETGRCR